VFIKSKVYFPVGTYAVSSPIVDYYDTQLIGDADCMPVLKASSNFSGGWVIEGDPVRGLSVGFALIAS
jgi:glucan 1,3-beta-glucosidase